MGNQTKQTEFFVSKNESNLGPWMMVEIASRMKSGELDASCFIFVEAADEWQPLMDCAELKSHMESSKATLAKPKAPPKPAPKSVGGTAPASSSSLSTEMKTEGAVSMSNVTEQIRSAEAEVKAVHDRPETNVLSAAFARKEAIDMGANGVAEWFVQKGPNRYGPFTFTGLVRALQEKSVFEYELIWKNGMDNWIRLAEHPDFSRDSIRKLQTEMQSESGVFFRRQHDRVSMTNEVMVHDNRSVWMGKAFEGSAGGSGVVIENATLVPGQVVLLHFASGDGLPSFNALCEIVSKKFQSQLNDAEAPVSYGLRFIKIDARAETKVQDFFRTRTVAGAEVMHVNSMKIHGRKASSTRAA